MTKPYQGGCLCGAARYEISAPPTWTGHCHCTMCRKASGAPVVTFITVPSAAFRLIKGALTTYVSSAKAKRQFCPTCGAQITFQYNSKPEAIDVTTGGLDDQTLVKPEQHVWWSTHVPYLHLADELPHRPEPTG